MGDEADYLIEQAMHPEADEFGRGVRIPYKKKMMWVIDEKLRELVIKYFKKTGKRIVEMRIDWVKDLEGDEYPNGTHIKFVHKT